MRLDRTAIYYFVTRVGSTLSGFLATIYIARKLGAGVLGQYFLAVGVLFWLTIPAMGVGTGVQKRVSEGDSKARYFCSGFLINAVIAVVLGLVITLFSGKVNGYVGAPIHHLLIALLVGNVSYVTVRSALIGEEKVAQMGGLRAVERIFRSGLQIWLLFSGFGLYGLLTGHLVSILAGTVVGTVMLDGRFALPGWRHLRGVTSFAKYAWITSLQGRVYSWLDTIVLGFFVAPELIGIYEAAWRIASVLSLTSSALQNTLFPRISSLETEGDYERIRDILTKAFVFVGVLAIPGLFGAAVVGDRLLRFYRPVFAKGLFVLVILVFARLVDVYYAQLNSVIVAIDRPDIGSAISLGFTVTNAVMNVVLVSVFGWHGAAVATALSATLALVASHRYVGRLVGFPRLPYRELGKQILASGLMTVVLLVVEPTMPLNNYTTLALVLLGACVYWVSLLGISPNIRESLLDAIPI